MISTGEFRSNGESYCVAIEHQSNPSKSLVVLWVGNEIKSVYLKKPLEEFSAYSNRAKQIYDELIGYGLKKCNSKNGSMQPFVLGASMLHIFSSGKKNVKSGNIELYNKELVSCQIESTEYNNEGAEENHSMIITQFNDRDDMRNWLFSVENTSPLVKLHNSSGDLSNIKGGSNIIVRSVEEIALEKEDITWIKNKKYYIVNDDYEAERIFSILDKYQGLIAYDVETTGLRINKFGKVGSEDAKRLEKYNLEHPDEQLRVDKLVGIIFCIEPNVSYYFPVENLKFKNLYESGEVREQLINNIKARYTVGDKCNDIGDEARYIRETPASEFRRDVILMERIRDILERLKICTHGGSYEQKVAFYYDILVNIVDDSMILHQILYKFRGTTSNRGEPSNLKHLSKVDLGIDQWELKDFFPQYKEMQGETKNVSPIDFSLMEYDGTKIYAPTDGDCTLQLTCKYKKDMMDNHRDQQYIYSVEVAVMRAMAYMEFYGIRFDVSKINQKRDDTTRHLLILESKFRECIGFSSANEILLREQLENGIAVDEQLRQEIDSSSKKVNINAPNQVAEVFYDMLKYPMTGDSRSVDKKKVKALCQYKNDDGTDKYPAAVIYKEYKAEMTLLTKFFGKLQDFMYLDGFVFASYGQISTATGRMSCSKPNLQQMPKSITKIIIPRENCVFCDADYSQIEYRTLCGMAHEPKLIEEFKNPDMDYHTTMASLMYSVPYEEVTKQMRSDSKSLNFGIPYGMGNNSLAILLFGVGNAVNRELAAEKKELYFKNQPNVKQFFADVKEQAQIYGMTKTLWNRIRSYTFVRKDGTVNNAARASALRQAGNAVIQGCLDGNTRIQTKEFGIVKIKDVVNTHLKVWDGDKWSNGDILYSGKKQKCIVHFSNGQKFICSPIHKFLVKSSKGNERFVECKDLRGSNTSLNPSRVVINRKYEASDFKYSSDWARKYKTFSNNSKNIFLDHIGDSFEIGIVLGRLASDGSIFNRDIGGSFIRQIVAEHEYNILPDLSRYMEKLKFKQSAKKRDGRKDEMTYLDVYSQSLVSEVDLLDVKHEINNNIFMDTELLRGFLRGFFDGDGGISGKTITLTFGKQCDFEVMCRDIQKALLFFGIRSRYYEFEDRYKITIKTNDNQKFLDLIGFMNEEKQSKGRELTCIRDEHIFGPTLVVQSVEITDEWIDMYDVCNTDGGYYVADGIITHNTAADIFKIGVARNFMWIVQNGLLGKVFISNMIHDEQLIEINYKELNVKKVVANIGSNMGFRVDGLPPLYVGAGVSDCWYKAKDSMAEIHPNLMAEYQMQTMNEPLFGIGCYNSMEECVNAFDEFNHDFRRRKVIEYLRNPENIGKKLHPVIGSLLNLAFNYGEENESIEEHLRKFISNEHVDGITADMFSNEWHDTSIEEEDVEYEDDEDAELDSDNVFNDYEFTLIDESSNVYGMSIIDWIETFTLVASKEKKIVGIDTRKIDYKKMNTLIDYLGDRACEKEDPDAMRVVFLKGGRILEETEAYVKDIDSFEFNKIWG